MSSNFFAQDNSLPNIDLNRSPKIKSSLPRIKMSGDNEILFDIDGKSITMAELADNISNIYFMS